MLSVLAVSELSMSELSVLSVTATGLASPREGMSQ
jgi:hypothetical protein